MRSKINIALLGCGRISKKHIKAIADNIDYYKLVAVCDINIDKAKDLADQFRVITKNQNEIKLYNDYESMLQNEIIDLVSILTPSGHHFEHSMTAIKYSKNVLVEKPMAMSVKEADLMINYAKNSGVSIGVCYQKRFNNAIVMLKKALENKDLGKIFVVNAQTHWCRTPEYYKQSNWRGTRKMDGGTLMNQSIHIIDIVLWLLGLEIVSIDSLIKNFNHPINEVEDYAVARIKFSDDVIANIESTVNIYEGDYAENIIVIAEKGFVHIGGKAINQVLEWRTEKSEKHLNEEIADIYGNGHSSLYKDYAIKKEFKINGVEGRKALSVIEDIYSKGYHGGE